MEFLGKTLGNYRIDRLLGEGGMGAVYHASDLSLQREVAIKLIHPHLVRQPVFRERFIHEARIMAHLDHPGIVRVYHMGAEKDLLYLPMEFIKGGNLRQLLDRLIQEYRWIPLKEAILLVQQLCQVVEYAHQRGVLHRDIKPANLMIKSEPTDGLPFRVVLTDLGLAKLLQGLELTQEGTYLGTPAYMSPEQASGQPTDARSDVYSLGILLYQLSIGRLPFPIRTVSEAMRYHTQEAPPPPRLIRPELPETVEQVILKAMEKKRENRYPSAAALGAALWESLGSSTDIIEQADRDSVSLVTEYETSVIASPSSTAASLMTVLGSEPGVQQEAPVFGNEPIPPSSDVRIQVMHKEHTAKVVPLPSGTVTIGRGKENGIVLDDEQASRNHAQITWDGLEYHVMDLDSSNGTYLDKTKLLPGVPVIWRKDKVLRIGDTWLRLIQPAAKAASEKASLLDSNITFAHSSAGVVGVSVAPQQLSVEAGGSVTVTVVLLNQSPEVDHFSISVTGVPMEWISSLPPDIQLMPGEQKETAFSLQVPRTPESQAGPHPMTLNVTSQRDPGESVEVRLVLTIGAYAQFESELQPQRLRTGNIGILTISNQGNRLEKFTIQFQDPAHELSFQPTQLEVEVPPGKLAAKNFQAQLRETRWIGGQKIHPFIASISLPKGERQTLQGNILSRGLIPAWLLPVVLLLCLGLLGVLGLVIPPLLPTPTPTPTLTATLTSSPTPERGVPIVQEWCVYRSAGPAPTSFTDCEVQVTAEVGEQLSIAWRVSNADEVLIEPFGNRPLSGEMTVTVTEGMTAFGLKASNASGKSIQKSVQINVVLLSDAPAPATQVPPAQVRPTQVPPPQPTQIQPPTVQMPPPDPAEFGQGLFASTDGSGNIPTIRQHTDWDRNWDVIIPGNFGGDGYTDLLFYKRSTGAGLFVSTDGSGNLATIQQHTWDRDWDVIIPGNFGGDGYTDLLFYKRSTGAGLFVSTDGSGNIPTIRQHMDWDRSWDVIIPGNFGGDGYTDLLFYKRSTGAGLFVSTDGSGNLATIQQHTWDRDWDVIVPGDFGVPAFTDLLFYK